MKNILALCAVFMLISGCASIVDKKYQTSKKLEVFSSVNAATEYVISHNKIHQKIYKKGKPSLWTYFFNSNNEVDVEEVMVTGLRASIPESITNNQEAGVDEGDIVKKVGDYLVILRQGRLYSILVGGSTDNNFEKVGELSVSLPEWQYHAWYDELLVHENTLIVIGFSYELGSAIYALFSLSETGGITFDTAYLIPSEDYYDESNYSARLINGNMVMLLNGSHNYNQESSDKSFAPEIYTINKQGDVSSGYSLFSKNEIFKPIQFDESVNSVTVAICPIGQAQLKCTAKTLIGNDFPAYYVSPSYIYIWGESRYWGINIDSVPVGAFRRAYKSNKINPGLSILYRIPLWDEGISAIQLKGSPIDQFSFSENQGNFYFTARESTVSDEWFYAAYDKGDAYWAKITPSDFNNTDIVNTDFYYNERNFHRFAKGTEGEHVNRFVGENLLLAVSYEYVEGSSTTFSVNLQSGQVNSIDLDVGIDQIHPIGNNALLLGSADESVSMFTLNLQNTLSIVDRYDMFLSDLTETRSHGFNFKPTSFGGVAGIPMSYRATEEQYKKINNEYYIAPPVTDMFYLGISKELNLYEAGELKGDTIVAWEKDDCEVSCYDWYGSSRPFFVGDRVFSLLKDELVEGFFSENKVYEKRRLNIRK